MSGKAEENLSLLLMCRGCAGLSGSPYPAPPGPSTWKVSLTWVMGHPCMARPVKTKPSMLAEGL